MACFTLISSFLKTTHCIYYKVVFVPATGELQLPISPAHWLSLQVRNHVSRVWLHRMMRSVPVRFMTVLGGGCTSGQPWTASSRTKWSKLYKMGMIKPHDKRIWCLWLQGIMTSVPVHFMTVFWGGIRVSLGSQLHDGVVVCLNNWT